MTKLPVASTATLAPPCNSAVVVLTRKSEPVGLPAASYRRAHTSPLLFHATTNAPPPAMATCGVLPGVAAADTTNSPPRAPPAAS